MNFEEYFEAHSDEMYECGKHFFDGSVEAPLLDIKMPNVDIDKNDLTLVLTDEFKKYFETIEYRQIYANLTNEYTKKMIAHILSASNIVMNRCGNMANFCVVNITNGTLLKHNAGYAVSCSEQKDVDNSRLVMIGVCAGITVYVDSTLWASDGTVLVGRYDEVDETHISKDKIISFNCQY